MTDRTERDETPDPSEGLRPTWSRSSRRLPRKVVQPLQAFLQTEISSAILLLAATAAALDLGERTLLRVLPRFLGYRAHDPDRNPGAHPRSPGLGVRRADVGVLPARRSGDQAGAPHGRAAGPPAGGDARARRARGHAGARGDLPRLHRGHRCDRWFRDRDADRHRLRPRGAHARPERARRVEGGAAHAGDRRRPREHRRRRLRRLERRRRLGPGGRARDLRRVRGPVADRRSGRRRVRGARARVVGGARCRWCRADARRGGHRVPHAGRRLPASATRERRGAPGRRSHARRAGSAGRRRGAVARPRAHVAGGGLAFGPSRGAPVALVELRGGPALRAGQRRCPAVRSRGRGGREQPSRARHPHLQDRRQAPRDRARRARRAPPRARHPARRGSARARRRGGCDRRHPVHRLAVRGRARPAGEARRAGDGGDHARGGRGRARRLPPAPTERRGPVPEPVPSQVS